MANPSVVSINENTVTKIATSVTAGNIHMLKPDMKYFQTYRLTGETAPSLADMQSEGARMFISGNEELISASAAIDVYCLCYNEDTTNSSVGKVRGDV